MSLVGCGALSPFTVESPRPKEYQTNASKEVMLNSIPTIISAQIDKQRQIRAVTVSALHNISKATTAAQVESIAKIVPFAVDSIEHADGTNKILGAALNNYQDANLTQATSQYLAYAFNQANLASENREKLKQYMSSATSWGLDTIAELAGGGILGTGLISALVLTMLKSRKRSQLLKADGQVIEAFDNQELKDQLAKAHSSLGVDAKKEHGLV